MNPLLSSSKSYPENLKIALAQCATQVGRVQENGKIACQLWQEAKSDKIDLLVFPELFLSGYPPEDLVLKPAFIAACQRALEDMAGLMVDGPDVLIGLPWRDQDTGRLYNAVAHLAKGRVEALRFKNNLPNYGVFDEKRVFAEGPLPEPLLIRNVSVGVPICEDLWTPDVCSHLAQRGAELLISPNGSPYWQGKHEERLAVLRQRVKETSLPVLYVNYTGGQDELVFDGGSCLLDHQGQVLQQGAFFKTDRLVSSWRRISSKRHESLNERPAPDWRCEDASSVQNVVPDQDTANWLACVTGLRDYVRHNGFHNVVLGLSGGIDSAVVAAMAVDALGPDHVQAMMLPYHYTSALSLQDAEDCAGLLKIAYHILPIESAVEGHLQSLQALEGFVLSGLALENIQSRIRGTLLMALSNQQGSMLLTTGNKSEMSVGYATLYGDMNGGFNPLKDVYKTDVFKLARWRNENHHPLLQGPKGKVIPLSILNKPPSAELRPDQKDEDSLPPYDILDAILTALVDEEATLADLVKKGYEPALVSRIENLLYLAEYKRRQAPPGVKISRKHFGRDRRYPITHGWRDR
jgi:NAD+ synthase